MHNDQPTTTNTSDIYVLLVPVNTPTAVSRQNKRDSSAKCIIPPDELCRLARKQQIIIKVQTNKL